ncbi:MAG: phosphotransferase [Actinomycetota bacterium]
MGRVAGREVGMPASVEEVDAAWLTSVLRTSGAISSEHSVASVTLEPFAEGLGFLSILHRATMTYDGAPPDAPETVIIKMITDLAVQRGIAETLQFYPRELRFYQEVAPSAGFRSPKAHAAMMADDSAEFVLVMEDLSAIRQLDQVVGVNREDSLLAAETMTRMHAGFAGKDLSDLATTFLPFSNPMYEIALPQIFASGWDTCKAEAGDLLSPEVIAMGDRFGELVPWFMRQFSSGGTLVHADWRADNLMVDDSTGEMVVIDFQIMGTGVPTYDLGYFMSQSMEPEVRTACGQEVIDRYFSSLAATGVDYAAAGFDEAELHNAMRQSMAWCLIYPVSMFGGWDDLTELHQQTALQMLRRSATAIDEYDALALLPD